jgi:hypothetical protein
LSVLKKRFVENVWYPFTKITGKLLWHPVKQDPICLLCYAITPIKSVTQYLYNALILMRYSMVTNVTTE